MATDLRKQKLQAERVQLLESIKKCDETLQESQNKQHYIAFSSDSSDEEMMDRRPIKVLATKPPSMYELMQECEKLESCELATKELTMLHIENYDSENLPHPPEDMKVIEEQLECDWHKYSAQCRLAIVPFSITFLSQTPRKNIVKPPYRRRFYRVRLSLSKKQHALEWSRARHSQGGSPSAEILALRAYTECVRSRSDTLVQICDQYQEKGHITLEPSNSGGHRIKGPQSLFELEWTIVSQEGCNDKFIHRFEILLKELGEEFSIEFKKVFNKLCDRINTTAMRTPLLAELIDMCLSVDSDLISSPSNSELTEKNDSDTEKEVQQKDKGKKGKRRNRKASIDSQETQKL